ncbi:hypothetical protein NDU88_007478 [Pleurodeles waltl]|uniref:Uncharacterized protein n=1 Tax=Pleurodeles waltl TaxID=8319 RepID=A0AAV7NTE3_PLEWA|nr:hypothetical protein NDU88_007478 [Pleurodeles waltl]
MRPGGMPCITGHATWEVGGLRTHRSTYQGGWFLGRVSARTGAAKTRCQEEGESRESPVRGPGEAHNRKPEPRQGRKKVPVAQVNPRGAEEATHCNKWSAPGIGQKEKGRKKEKWEK